MQQCDTKCEQQQQWDSNPYRKRSSSSSTQPIKVHWISVTVAKTDDLVFPNYSPKTDKLIFPRPTSKAVFPQPWIRMGEIGAFEKNQSTQKVEFSQSWVTPSSSSSSSTMPVTFPGLWQTNPLSKRRWIRFERIKSCLDISLFLSLSFAYKVSHLGTTDKYSLGYIFYFTLALLFFMSALIQRDFSTAVSHEKDPYHFMR